MDRWYYTINLLIYLFCSSVYALNDWSKFTARDIYPNVDKTNCVFPFTYRDTPYKDCTTDGDNGDMPWCALKPDYQGLFTYCYDFWNSTLTCLPKFSINGKEFDKCDYLSKGALYKQCKTNHTKFIYRNCIEEYVKKSGKPLVHPNTCDPAYKNLSSVHTMCMGPSDFAIQIKINETEKQELLDKHNEFRAFVPSRYMFRLYWDDELAKLAQAHANLCAFDHDLAVNRLSPKFKWKNGQNMVMSTDIRSSLASLLDTMLREERTNYKYAEGCYKIPGSCLHYTQAMLSNMTRVGCAHTHCLFPHRVERHLTCNYIHSQYTNNYKTPYVPSGTPAIDCLKKYNEKLCDCGDKICKYDVGEYLEPSTCNCKKQVHKRSINEKDLKDGTLQNDELFIAAPNGFNIDLHEAKKRSFKEISQNKLDNKHSGKNSNVNQEEQNEVVHNIHAIENTLPHQ